MSPARSLPVCEKLSKTVCSLPMTPYLTDAQMDYIIEKMNEFAAIMGLCNLKRMDKAAAGRQRAYEQYMKGLAGVKGLRFFDRSDTDSQNYAYFPVLIEEEFWTSRDGLYDALKQEGIHARKYFYPLTADEACFKNKYKDEPLEVARTLSKQVLCLPFYEDLDEESAVHSTASQQYDELRKFSREISSHFCTTGK